MKRILFLIGIFLLFKSTGFCQTLTDFLLGTSFDERHIFNLKEVEIPDSIKQCEVNKLKGYEHFDYLAENFENHKNEFIFLDLNSDNKIDILYSGYLGGAAAPYAYIFTNENDKYYGSLYENGFWEKGLYDGEKFIGLLFNYVPYFNPCSQMTYLELIKFDYSINIERIVNLSIDTYEPKKFFKNAIGFTVQNEKYYLRSSPKIDDIEVEDCEQIGNIVYTYKIFDKGIAYAEETDETGRVWWFVVMSDKKAGWMSNRFLKSE